MSVHALFPSKSISELVAEGSLVDVTEVAKKFNLPHRMFLTRFMADKFKARGPDGLEVSVFFLVDYLLLETGLDRYGPDDNGEYACILEPHEEYGHVVLVAEHGKLEELGIRRMTDDRFEYAM